MTKAEVERYIEGATWQLKLKAQLDYTLANLIGIAFAKSQGSKMAFPTVEEAYPGIFSIENNNEPEEQRQAIEEVKMKNSQNRFLEFALKHNAKMKQGVEKVTEYDD